MFDPLKGLVVYHFAQSLQVRALVRVSWVCVNHGYSLKSFIAYMQRAYWLSLLDLLVAPFEAIELLFVRFNYFMAQFNLLFRPFGLFHFSQTGRWEALPPCAQVLLVQTAELRILLTILIVFSYLRLALVTICLQLLLCVYLYKETRV